MTRPSRWPEALAVAVFLVAVIWTGRAVMRDANGAGLAMDDAYTHLAMARTLAETGTYGVAPGHPSGASSSPLWVVLLAGAFVVTGPTVLAPVVLSAVAGAGVLLLLGRWWREGGWPDGQRAAALLLIALAIPLPALAWLGMEHVAQLWGALWLVTTGATACAVPDGERVSRRQIALLAVAAAVSCGIRYETIAFVVAVAMALAWRRRWWAAITVTAGGLLVPALHAAWAARAGEPWLPTAILARSVALMEGLDSVWFDEPGIVPFAALAVAVATAVIRSPRHTTLWRAADWLPVMAAAGAMVHLAGIHEGAPFGRYDAVLLCVLAAVAGARVKPGSRLAIAAGACLVALIATRGFAVSRLVPIAAGEISRQQGQLVRLCRDVMRGATIGVNDIGAVSWAGCPLVDYTGLATGAVARLRVAPDAPPQDEILRRATREGGVALIAIYDDWFAEKPAEWVPVGEFTLSVSEFEASPTVTIYAPDSGRQSQVAAWFDTLAAGVGDGVTARRLR